MKKIYFALAALMMATTINAQTVKLYKGETLVQEYTADQVDRVVFAETEAEPEVTGMNGTAKATIEGQLQDVAWVQMWADGPRFATVNVGVTNGKVDACGGYYTWGGSASMDDAYSSSLTDIQGTDEDTAKKLWGDNWMMPTKDDLQGLLDNCDCTTTYEYNTTCTKFTGRGDYAGQVLILPWAGMCTFGSVYDIYAGDYWSSTPQSDDWGNYASLLEISDYNCYVARSYGNIGYSVRAILSK